MFDYNAFEAWEEHGSPDTEVRATARVRQQLAEYQPPALDPGIAEGLLGYTTWRKAAVADTLS